MTRVLFVLGTRPEAIKLAPVILHQKARPEQFHVTVCVTGQHRNLVDQVLPLFGIVADYDLDVMLPGQTLCELSARVLSGLELVLPTAKPHLVVVHGDTTTTLCGALAGFYQRIPVAHVEAGLRTGDLQQPMPEEMNRVLTGRLASLHFAPTASARGNLLREGCGPTSIFVTGNSGVDAIQHICGGLEAGKLQASHEIEFSPEKKLLLVTAHRRENFGPGFQNICSAIAQLARRSDVQIVFPVHPNPQIRCVAEAMLGGQPNVKLTEPLPYISFVDVMRRAHLIVTDSGGIQEEAPCLGKPVLLLREKTERMEGVLAGTVKLVGTSEPEIVARASELLDDNGAYQAMAKVHSPYGDGNASARISQGILSYFDRQCGEVATGALQNLSRAVGTRARLSLAAVNAP
jgi:UDP-N-acetylglucosamine 2-epimerase